MGVTLSDGYQFYLPQGVFYINSPTLDWKPNSRQASYTLTDKWAYLDGSLFGELQDTYEIGVGENIFGAMQAVLQLSRFSLAPTSNVMDMIDPITPIFTDYFNNRTTTVNGQAYPNNLVPYEVVI